MSRFLFLFATVFFASQGWALGVSSTMPWANTKLPPEQRIKLGEQFLETIDGKVAETPFRREESPTVVEPKIQSAPLDYWQKGDTAKGGK